uniref:ST3 beta-galactoside alpha-2,3-sialyltransferase 1 n=1 Tax=Gadus morhua TaxID=8049 RepID=A0A8C4ZVV7_GADMO
SAYGERRGVYTILFMTGIMCILVILEIATTNKHLWISKLRPRFQLEALPPFACNRCVTEDDDPWFTKRFNASLNPTCNLAIRPFSARVAELKVFEIFPQQESFMDSSPDRCRTCAVVGNSVNLLRSHYGPLIDLHDVIMRDVGNKTTLDIMYPESAVDLDDHTHLILFPFKIRDLEWLVSAFTTKSVTMYVNVMPLVLYPGFIQYVHENWLGKKGRYPSTGFMGVVLAMHICDEVSVFGFGADKDGNWRHYWEELQNKNLGTGPHGGGQEYKRILELAEKQKLNFYKGF